MGFNVRRVFHLVFEDPALLGLEVRAHSVSMDTFLRITKLANDAKKMASGDDGAVDMTVVAELFSLVGEALVSWNAEADDRAIPANAEGLGAMDIDIALTLIKAWMDAIGGVSGPLGRTSSDGAPSEEASIPMETLPLLNLVN